MVFNVTLRFGVFKVGSPREMTKIHQCHVQVSGWCSRREGDVHGGVGVVPALPHEDPFEIRVATDGAELDVDLCGKADWHQG